MARKIEILPYNPTWVEDYREEITRLSGIVGVNLVATHHIGSTAIPGLAAKPTLDILWVMRDLETLDACYTEMSELGYTAKGENGIPGRRYFQRVEDEQHLAHIHAFKEGHPEITRMLNFRDYLIAHPQTANEYEALKQQLAVQFRDVPMKYTQGKEEFIRAVDKRAAAWRSSMDHEIGKSVDIK